MSYGKLVRDFIPKIIKENGEIPIIKILNDQDYKKELEKKLLEESYEVINASGEDRIEELADLLEVMIALGALEGKTLKDILLLQESKREKRGAFEKKVYLEDVQK